MVYDDPQGRRVLDTGWMCYGNTCPDPNGSGQVVYVQQLTGHPVPRSLQFLCAYCLTVAIAEGRLKLSQPDATGTEAPSVVTEVPSVTTITVAVETADDGSISVDSTEFRW